MVDRPATSSTLLTVASGQAFSTSLIPTAVGNATKVFDVDSALTDTSISGAYIDDIWFRYSKRVTEKIDARTATSGTYSAASTTATITISAGHNLEVGQQTFLNFTSYNTGAVPIDGTFTVVTITPTTFTVTIPNIASGTVTGNVDVYDPIDFCFYLVSLGTVTNINQFFPLFVASIDAVAAKQYCSLTMKEVLPLINHPVVQAGSNFGSDNNEIAPKQRGLMLKRGQALYVSVSGTAALTNGFYCNVQGGYY
tara:strand:- start:117 stop:875 length:759 start_codon:yes stop_codon:yes gene_type:complete